MHPEAHPQRGAGTWESAAESAGFYVVLSAQLLLVAAVVHLNPPLPVLLLTLPALAVTAVPTASLARLYARTAEFKLVTAAVLGRVMDAATTYAAIAAGLPELNHLWLMLPPLAMLALQLAVGAALGALAAGSLRWTPAGAPRPLTLALRAAGCTALAVSWFPVVWNAAALALALAP